MDGGSRGLDIGLGLGWVTSWLDIMDTVPALSKQDLGRDVCVHLCVSVCESQGNILENIDLIEGLEETKRTAVEIEEKVKLAKMTEIQIAKAREVYRPVATRGSLVYFLIDNLNALDRVYHYSMANFVFVLKKGMDMTPGSKDESKVRGSAIRAWEAKGPVARQSN